MKPGRLRTPVLGLALAICPLAQAQESPADSDVAPIFAERCMLCHAGEGAPLGLRPR